MRPLDIPTTKLDREIAHGIVQATGPATESSAQLLSWGADEHVLLTLSAVWWMVCQTNGQHRRESTHLLLLAGASAVVPHIAKRAFNQTRPDRLTVTGHWRGVPVSGKSRDAFPSGHAVHMGALASAATSFPPRWRALSWSAVGSFSAARVILLAHWTSDVAVGLAVGAAIDRLLRRVTGFGSPDRMNGKAQ